MDSNASDFTPFSSGQSQGVIVVAVFALLSALALAFIAFRSIGLVVIPLVRRDANTYNAPENLFFRTTLGHYAACLVLSNVFISAAGLIEFDWAAQSGIRRGSLCSAQAVLMQIGSWSTCFFTVAIGLHTCNSLVFRLRHHHWLSPSVIAIGWVVSAVAALSPLHVEKIYGPVGISCGITSNNHSYAFVLEAFPVILGAVMSLVLYSLIFLVLQGKLRIKGGVKFTFKTQERWSALSDFEEYHRFIGAIAKSMFWYPIAFVVFLLPFCVVSLLPLSGVAVPYAADILAHVCCFMLGLVNVALLYNTFRVLSPVFHRPTPNKIQVDTEKTFGNEAFDESPVLPPIAVTLDGPSLPLYTSENRGSSLSQSSTPSDAPLLQHSRTSSDASTNSATHLLSVRRKPALRVIVPASELSRQLSGVTAPSRQLSKADRGLRLNLPSNEPVSPALVTVSLSPAPRKASTVPPPTHITSVAPAVAVPRSPIVELNRQITEAFGKRPRGSRVDPRVDLHLEAPSPLPIGNVASPAGFSFVVNGSTSQAATPERRKPDPLDLTAALHFAPAVRRLPSIETPVRISVPKMDKGKGKAPPPPVTPVPAVQVSITAATPGGNFARPLPYIPSTAESLMSPTPRSSISASGPSRRLPLPHSPITSHVSHSRTAIRPVSPHPSRSSVVRSSFASEVSFYSSSDSSSTRGSIRPLPNVPKISDKEDLLAVSDSHPRDDRQTLQSRRTTMTSVWSQDSAESSSQPPDVDAALAYASLFPGGLLGGEPLPLKTAPHGAAPRLSIPNALRPGHAS